MRAKIEQVGRRARHTRLLSPIPFLVLAPRPAPLQIVVRVVEIIVVRVVVEVVGLDALAGAQGGTEDATEGGFTRSGKIAVKK